MLCWPSTCLIVDDCKDLVGRFLLSALLQYSVDSWASQFVLPFVRDAHEDIIPTIYTLLLRILAEMISLSSLTSYGVHFGVATVQALIL